MIENHFQITFFLRVRNWKNFFELINLIIYQFWGLLFQIVLLQSAKNFFQFLTRKKPWFENNYNKSKTHQYYLVLLKNAYNSEYIYLVIFLRLVSRVFKYRDARKPAFYLKKHLYIRWTNQLNKISPLSFISWQLNAKKTFFDIAYGFPVIVMTRGLR